MRDVLVIGGGASGMMAALHAARLGASVTVLESQPRVGRKLLSTGNGRCNLTNTAAAAERYHGASPRFVAAVLGAFPPSAAIEFFNALGVMTVEEYGGRVFPRSNSASSVLDVLRCSLEASGVSIRTETRVDSLARTSGGYAASCGGATFRGGSVIVACGGAAGAKIGGTSDGYRLLRSLGHTIRPLYPSLCPIPTISNYPPALKGVKVSAHIRLLKGGEDMGSAEGDVLFTDSGVSGTAVFDLSRTAAASHCDCLELDFLHHLTDAALLSWLHSRCTALPNLPANDVFLGALQNRLGRMVCRRAQISGRSLVGSLRESDLRSLVREAKRFRLPIGKMQSVDGAQVTAGGADTAEFDPLTLESRLNPGLYACGEVLDVDGDCGGHNLQWAWSSGYVAGRSAV